MRGAVCRSVTRWSTGPEGQGLILDLWRICGVSVCVCIRITGRDGSWACECDGFGDGGQSRLEGIQGMNGSYEERLDIYADLVWEHWLIVHP